nr:hypothetical protein GCM10020092_004660 [Actinoplanes digitatis]
MHVFAEADYCYGIGPLTLRVDRIEWAKPIPYEGDTWLEVEGIVIDPAGRERARRQVLVRAVGCRTRHHESGRVCGPDA